uniref:Uncharacterized protein n=1 Tax=Lactuca sativa TaxID=4236 RepID=A0A9R1VYI7_LACSA|nr:hypothetical protein LSAT_V11C400201270 [Lactuca sativa]
MLLMAKTHQEGDLNLLKDYRPNWIKKDVDHIQMETFITIRENNRNKLEDGSVSKHTMGSISIRQHKKRMQEMLKRPPTGVELYARLHTKRSTQEYITPKAAKVKEAYESAMVAKFGDDTSCHPLLDNETWCDVSGGVKKGRIASQEVRLILYFIKISYHSIVLTKFPIMALYLQSFLSWHCTYKVFYHGIILTKFPIMAWYLQSFLSWKCTYKFPYHDIVLTKFPIMVVYERVRNEMRGEMDAKAAEMEAKHQQMREEMDAKAAAIDAKQQQIDAKYEAMEKMYAALQNMMGN